MTHLEFDFESPIWRHLYRELSRDHAFYRYDARGNGLSDREVPDVHFDNFVDDLEEVFREAGFPPGVVKILYAPRDDRQLARDGQLEAGELRTATSWAAVHREIFDCA